MKIACVACMVLASLAALPGCRTPKERTERPDRYQPITGALRSTLDAPLDRVWAAAQASVDELALRSSSKSKDALNATLVAKAADGSDVRVRLERRAENTTDIFVNVGSFGRRATAEAVLERIRAKLAGTS
jgi:hypothetical protein